MFFCNYSSERVANNLSPVQNNSLKFEAKKPYDFDRNQKGCTLSKKEQPSATGRKTRKN